MKLWQLVQGDLKNTKRDLLVFIFKEIEKNFEGGKNQVLVCEPFPNMLPHGGALDLVVCQNES